MKIKIDENLPLESAIILKNAGYDVHTINDEGIVGCSDDVVFSACIKEGRVLITLDMDFTDIRRYLTEQSPGIVVFRTRYQDKHTVLRTIELLIEEFANEEVIGKLWIVEDGRIRIRE